METAATLKLSILGVVYMWEHSNIYLFCVFSAVLSIQSSKATFDTPGQYYV